MSGVSLGGPVTIEVNTSSSAEMVGGSSVPTSSVPGIFFSVTSTSPQAALAVLITPTGKFAAAGTLAAATPQAAGLSLSGQLSIQVNTSSTAVTITVPGAGSPTTIQPGTLTATASGATLTTPLGVITGTVTVGTDAATNGTKIDITSASLQIGSPTGSGFTVTGNAYVLVLPGGLFAFRASGSAALSGIMSLAFTGNFAGEYNNTGQNVTLADDTDMAPVLAGADNVQGTNVTVNVGSGVATLTGNFAVAVSTSGLTAGDVVIGATGLSTTIGPNGGPQLSVTGGNLVAAVNNDQTYALQAAGTVSVSRSHRLHGQRHDRRRVQHEQDPGQ